MTNGFWLGASSGLLRFKSYSDLVENLYIKALIDSFQRLQATPGIKSQIENVIRNHLAYDLEKNNSILRPYLQNKILKLTKENTILQSPLVSGRTDIEFFMSFYGDFVVECKNLKSAEQRYITDGVSRFTTEFYSKDDSEAGMIGFIVGGNISSITPNLSIRVEKESTFDKTLKSHLSLKCLAYKDSFHSSHTRPTKGAILIHHLFVAL